MTFKVIAHRSGGVCGAASAPLKENGVELTFPSLEAAWARADAENRRVQDVFARAGKPCPIDYTARGEMEL